MITVEFLKQRSAALYLAVATGSVALAGCNVGGSENVSCSEQIEYTVQPDDTYGGIASQLNERYDTHLDIWKLGQAIQNLNPDKPTLTVEDHINVYNPRSC